MVGYKLSKNDWVTPFFVIFRSVREKLLVTVSFDHPVPWLWDRRFSLLERLGDSCLVVWEVWIGHWRFFSWFDLFLTYNWWDIRRTRHARIPEWEESIRDILTLKTCCELLLRLASRLALRMMVVMAWLWAFRCLHVVDGDGASSRNRDSLWFSSPPDLRVRIHGCLCMRGTISSTIDVYPPH